MDLPSGKSQLLTPTSQAGMTVGGAGTPLGKSTSGYQDANQFNLNAYYQPLDSGWIPSISAGWSISSFNLNDGALDGTVTKHKVGL